MQYQVAKRQYARLPVSSAMNERKVVSFKEAKKRRDRKSKVVPLPRQNTPHAPPQRSSRKWGQKAFHALQVVLFLIILSLFVKLCHGGSI